MSFDTTLVALDFLHSHHGAVLLVGMLVSVAISLVEFFRHIRDRFEVDRLRINDSFHVVVLAFGTVRAKP